MTSKESNPQRTAETIQTDWNLKDLVEELRISREEMHRVRYKGQIRELPSREALKQIIAELAAALFPTHYGQRDLTAESIDFFVGNTLHSALTDLAEQVRRGLRFLPANDTENDAVLHERAIDITRHFAAQLPQIRSLLVSDLHAAYQGDPAATSFSEILLCYPECMR